MANEAREYDFHTRFIELAADINEQMPYYVANRISEALNSNGKRLKDARVLVLGVAYKKDADDIRESPAIKIIKTLREKGAIIRYNDQSIASIQIGEDTLMSVDLTDDLLSLVDCIVIATDHSCYNYGRIAEKASLVFDARGVTRGLRNNNIIRL